MLKISETIVVEGKTDLVKIKQLVDANIITTNGSECSNETINLIKKTNSKSGVILFFDPDYVGEQIRKKIANHVPNCKHAFLTSNVSQKNMNKKNGVAEASDQDILLALKKFVCFSNPTQSISLFEFNNLNINSVKKRLFICEFLNISYCNNKQLLKRLQMMGISIEQVKSILEKYEN